MFILPVLLGLVALMVSVHCCISWLPLRWANLAIFVSVLEGLDKSEDLVAVSANWEIID
jgi:hypothetical protein